LSDRYHFAWNAPGYILSYGFKTDNPDCKSFADALNDFLAAVKLDRINLVGNSLGSRVAQCFAIYYPGRIIKLAMTGTSIGPHRMSEEQKGKIIATREGHEHRIGDVRDVSGIPPIVPEFVNCTTDKRRPKGTDCIANIGQFGFGRGYRLKQVIRPS
jgi:pimeloyl-ACP methyl ester carboxylesterase